MKKIKKIISVLIVTYLLFGRSVLFLTYADETSEEENVDQTQEDLVLEETEESVELEIDLENEAVVENDVNSVSNTGENAIEEEQTDDVVEESEQLVCEEPDISICEVTSQEECSDCEEEEPEEVEESSEVETSEDNVIETGDAVSIVEVENLVNTNEVDSEILFQTLNIFLSDDVNLTLDPTDIVNDIFLENNNCDPEVNISYIGVDNYSVISNDIVSLSNTGNNSINGSSDAYIDTGDAYSLVTLLNKANTTIVNSTIHIITINIFGEVYGDIILPDFVNGNESEILLPNTDNSVEVNNDVVISNNVNSEANSGENSIEGGQEGEKNIVTGDAGSTVNITNVANANYLNTVFGSLFINVIGEWDGDFLGWGEHDFIEGGDNLFFDSTLHTNNQNNLDDNSTTDINVENNTYIENNISSIANTGGNSSNGSGNASIATGNAFSVVSILNIINSTIINSLGFFGNINIFGKLVGDIGEESRFNQDSSTEESGSEIGGSDVATEDSGEEKVEEKESGGKIEVVQDINVGTHVLPGDTVAFFVDVSNPGTGKVYDAVLEIILLKDGVDLGGAVFKLGDIKQGEKVQVSTGLVLSKNTEPGEYIARSYVSGYVGPNNDLISDYDDDNFLIKGKTVLVPSGIDEISASTSNQGQVLGQAKVPFVQTQDGKMIIFFIGLLVIYLPAKAYQKREALALFFSRSGRFISSKLALLKTFFTSFFV